MTAIPVRVVDGQLEFFYGGPLPTLKPGIVGELVIPSFAFVDPSDEGRYSREKLVPLLPPGSSLWVEVNPHALAQDSPLRAFIHSLPVYAEMGRKATVVEILVNEGLPTSDRNENWLYLLVRGFKLPVLRDATTRVPALSRTVESVNEAYTLVSEAFEPHRRSHTGNVFDKVYVQSESLNRLVPLGTLRSTKAAEIEDDFIRSVWEQLRDAYGIAT